MSREETKICPFCREDIPLLAQKCRFCGEMVGAPLKSERQLSVDDIGRPTDDSKKSTGQSLVEAYNLIRSGEEAESRTAQFHLKKKAKKRSRLQWVVVALVVVVFVGCVFLILMKNNLLPPFTAKAKVAKLYYEANIDRAQARPVEGLRKLAKAKEIGSWEPRFELLLSDLVQLMEREVDRNKGGPGTFESIQRCSVRIANALSLFPENNQLLVLQVFSQDHLERYDILLTEIKTEGGNPVAILKLRSRLEDLNERTTTVKEGGRVRGMIVETINLRTRAVILYDPELKNRQVLIPAP